MTVQWQLLKKDRSSECASNQGARKPKGFFKTNFIMFPSHSSRTQQEVVEACKNKFCTKDTTGPSSNQHLIQFGTVLISTPDWNFPDGGIPPPINVSVSKDQNLAWCSKQKQTLWWSTVAAKCQLYYTSVQAWFFGQFFNTLKKLKLTFPHISGIDEYQ